MAEWIKVCKDTPQKRELGLVGEITGLSEAEVFWHWFKLFAWADDQTIDGFIPHFTLRTLARSSAVPLEICTAFAATQVGWLGEYGGENPGIMFKNWERHNGESAKKRAEASRRQQKHRLTRKCVTKA